ncbi:hypothetical protein G9P44_005154 [Scheffersomyces stipitis]|nr:hypothetical protein G9P44_005154 [Scheffersomyces stipitis]
MSISTSASRPATDIPFSRESLEQVLKRRFFFAPAFDIYGGVSGLYDYGPPGCAFQANVVDTWRKHFVLEEDMLEVDCTMLTPHDVLKTSGHVDKFADWMCKDLKTGEIFRADHLVEEVLEARLKGDRAARGIGEKVEEEDEDKKKRKKERSRKSRTSNWQTRSLPNTKTFLPRLMVTSVNSWANSSSSTKSTTPLPEVSWNLSGVQLDVRDRYRSFWSHPWFLRPETAQGQFLNFAKLLEFNNEKMPFASASIGKSFRNEIAPRAGLLRVREFLMAEIEHFVDPNDKSHPKFKDVQDIKLRFLPKDVQESGSTQVVEKSVGEAVSSGMVDNQTLGYFLARVYQFLIKVGVDTDRLRFRQHMGNEMAHYASDCWDAELQTSYGWIECVGCADRSAYDLSVHAARTNASLVVRQPLPEPITVENYEVDIDKKKFGPKFKKDGGAIQKWLGSRSQCELEDYSKELADKGKIEINVKGVENTVELTSEYLKIAKVKRTEHIREFTPNVIEPSFGIGRILYSIFEHQYWARPGDADRGVLSLPPLVAPTKVLLVPLSNSADLQPIVTKVSAYLRKQQIPFKVDDSSASIGKRYARNDELGTPFGITIDFDSIKDESVTLRERRLYKNKSEAPSKTSLSLSRKSPIPVLLGSKVLLSLLLSSLRAPTLNFSQQSQVRCYAVNTILIS